GSRSKTRLHTSPVSSETLSLGRALRTMSGLMASDGTKISAVGKNITSLDDVPPSVASRAIHLFLSNNNLCSLRDLESFSGVLSLSVANNLLRRTEDLRPLGALERVETMSLEGNPVCGASNYRAHVLCYVDSPRLKTLDHREILVFLHASGWPAFDRLELKAMERCGLDEAAELFGECLPHPPSIDLTFRVSPSPLLEWHKCVNAWRRPRSTAEVMAARRSKGQGTRDLSEGATATLDSPGTRMWTHVLEEVQRRIQAAESNLLACCEDIRRREADTFRRASSQTVRFLHDLAANVGCSDDQWAIIVPPRVGPHPPVPSQPRGTAPNPKHPPPKRFPDGDSITGGNHADATPGPMPVARINAPTASSPAVRHKSGMSEGHWTGAVAQMPPSDTYEETPPERPIHSGSIGLRSNDDHGARRVARGLTLPRRPVLVAPGHGGKGGELRTGPPQSSMVSAGMFLLARMGEEACNIEAFAQSAPRSSEQEVAAATVEVGKMVSEEEEGMSRRCGADDAVVKKGALIEWQNLEQSAQRKTAGPLPGTLKVDGDFDDIPGSNNARCFDDGKDIIWARHSSPRRTAEPFTSPNGIMRTSHPEAAAAGADMLTDAPAGSQTPRTITMSHGSPSSRHPRMPTSLPFSPTRSFFPTDTVVTTIGHQYHHHAQLARREHSRTASGTRSGGEAGKGWLNEDGKAHGARGEWAYAEDADTSSDGEAATKHLLEEAARIKRLLATMERSDAAAAAGEDADGLGDEDPTRFLANLGLVELKPIAPRLEQALDNMAPPLLDLLFDCGGGGGGDPSSVSAAPEPRTTRALRDQVIALGKEVARRAEQCMEGRKINAALRRQVEIARRARARNLDAVDVACRKLIAKAGNEVEVLHESRRVAREAERYHTTLAGLQERVDVTLSETRKTVSASEAIAQRLRSEIGERAAELSHRGRAATEELMVRWRRKTRGETE
ncbi:unnamed protein product, partial [Sphacelaria rigidula]